MMQIIKELLHLRNRCDCLHREWSHRTRRVLGGGVVSWTGCNECHCLQFVEADS